MGKSEPPLFSDVPDAEIWAFGNIGEGGSVKFRRGDEKVRIDLSPAIFDTLVALMLEVKQQQPSEAWVPRGFITLDRLCQRLKQLTQATPNNLDPDRQSLSKNVLRLRKKFARAFAPPRGEQRPGTPAWTKELIETHSSLGYRLAVPAERLHLALGSGPSEASRLNRQGIEGVSLCHGSGSEGGV